MGEHGKRAGRRPGLLIVLGVLALVAFLLFLVPPAGETVKPVPPQEATGTAGPAGTPDTTGTAGLPEPLVLDAQRFASEGLDLYSDVTADPATGTYRVETWRLGSEGGPPRVAEFDGYWELLGGGQPEGLPPRHGRPLRRGRHAHGEGTAGALALGGSRHR